MGLAQEDSVTILVWTAKLLYVLVGLLVPCQSLACRKGLVTSLQVNVCVYVCVCVCVVCVCVCGVCACVRCVCVCMHACACVCVYGVCVCMVCVCGMCVYIYVVFHFENFKGYKITVWQK